MGLVGVRQGGVWEQVGGSSSSGAGVAGEAGARDIAEMEANVDAEAEIDMMDASERTRWRVLKRAAELAHLVYIRNDRGEYEMSMFKSKMMELQYVWASMAYVVMTMTMVTWRVP